MTCLFKVQIQSQLSYSCPCHLVFILSCFAQFPFVFHWETFKNSTTETWLVLLNIVAFLLAHLPLVYKNQCDAAGPGMGISAGFSQNNRGRRRPAETLIAQN